MAHATLAQVLKIEVPVVVRLAESSMSLAQVVRWVPGSIVELSKSAEAELDLMCNDKQIGNGSAVKVGENFGIRLSFIGTVADRIAAMQGQADAASQEDADAADFAEALLAGQM
jgi:flagellar motor switch protein FliN